MPQVLETDIGEIELPDEFTLAQVQDFARTRLPTLREGLSKGAIADLPSRFARDVGVAGSSILKSIATGHTILRDAATRAKQSFLPSGAVMADGVLQIGEKAAEEANARQAATLEERLKAHPLYKAGEASEQNVRDYYVVNPQFENTKRAMLSRGLASTVPPLAAGIAGAVPAAITYALMAGQQGAEEAMAAGHPDKADEAYLTYAGLGAISEAAMGYPIALVRSIKAARQAGIPPAQFGKTFKTSLADVGKRIGTEMAKGFGREAVQESTEQAGQNVAAKMIGFEPDRELTRGVWEAFWVGGAVGALLGGTAGGLRAIDESPRNVVGRMLKEQGEMREVEEVAPWLADVEARAGMRPEMAQRTVIPQAQPVPAMLLGPPLPQEPPAEPSEPARRRQITPTPERPRFRPPPAVPPAAPVEQPPERTPEEQQALIDKALKIVRDRKAATPAPTASIPQGEVGGMLGSGEVRRTSSGRTTTPFPDVRTGTERKTSATVKRVDEWLRENAIEEAKARGDNYNAKIFEHSDPKNLSQSDKDSFEEYLFGQQPAVVPKVLKPLSQPPLPVSTTGKLLISDLSDAQVDALAESAGVKKDRATRIKLQELENKGLLDSSVLRPSPQPTEVPSAIPIRSPEAIPLETPDDQQVKTGILMAPGWRPEVGLRALAKMLKNAQELATALNSGKLVTAGPVLIRGNSFSVPSRNEFRGIWGDPQFNRLFDQSPIERRGEFAGELTSYGRNALFEFLKSKGLTASVQTAEAEGGAKYSVTLSAVPASQVGLAEVQAAFPAEQGFVVTPHADRNGVIQYLVKLPNGSLILINQTLETIAFDATKAAKDWGIDPESLKGLSPAGVWFKIDGLTNAGFIDLLNIAGPDTLSHEKFHALFDLALSPEERTAILKRYKTEEKAAEAFRRSEGFTRGFWDKMRRFIEWLANLVRGDAFKALRRRMDPSFVSQPTGRTEGHYSLEQVFQSKESLEQFILKPTISPEHAIAIRDQSGAQSALVPDTIADEIRALDQTDAVEKEVAALLDFVLRLHAMAPALDLRRILASDLHPDDLKDAAVSGVLRQIEHVKVKTKEIDDQLQIAMQKMVRVTRTAGKRTEEKLIEAQSTAITERLVTGYKAYLTAQAATLPADLNIAAARQQLLNRMSMAVTDIQKIPDATRRALEAIAARIGELPVAQGPQAVIDAIRQKGILKGVAGDKEVDMLLDEKPGGLPPLLLQPETNALLQQLAALQQKAEGYASQIEVIEKAFRGTGEPTVVELRKWAETYRRFRNKQSDATKVLAELDQQFREADQDVEVYGRSKEILERLQNDPLFRRQFETAINSAEAVLYKDIWEAEPNGDITYTSPLKQTDADGNEVQNTYKVHLAPDRQSDQQTISNMTSLILEINEFLTDPNVDPRQARTWTKRREYLQTHTMFPTFSEKVEGWAWETPNGIIHLNPFSWVKVITGGRATGPRSELERMAYRAAREANMSFLTTDHITVGFRLVQNNREYGDEVHKIAVLAAVASHGWDTTRIMHWKKNVLNPILAAGQNAGQMRLGSGNYIPGTGIKITKEDMVVARLEKRFSQAIVQTTQGTAANTPTILLHNPVLVEDVDPKGKRPSFKRRALSPGPLTMARHFSQWGHGFLVQWTAAKSSAERLRLLTTGDNFQMAVLGYVTTTNPEFESASTLKAVYEEYASRARTDEDAQVQSLDQLLERLADIAVAKKLFETRTEAIDQIRTTLVSEIGQHVEAFRKQVEEDSAPPSFATPEAAVQFASANNAFTKARKRMVAPDPYYDYTLTSDVSRLGFMASGYQVFQLRQIDALNRLSAALGETQKLWEKEIADLSSAGITPRRARAEVQKKTAKQQREGELRFSYVRLVRHKLDIDKILKDLSELIIDVRDPADSAALAALSKFSSTLSSVLLATPLAIANNTIGGVMGANFVTLRNLGRANLVLTPIKSTKATVKVLVKQLLAAYPVHTAIGKVAHSNVPVLNQMARLVDTKIREWIQHQAEAAIWGLRTPPDMQNRLRAAKALKESAGKIEEKPVPLMEAIPNWLESVPGLRQLLIQLRDKSPRVFDEVVNLATASVQEEEVFTWLEKVALDVFAAREANAVSTGRTDINDFTREENLLKPEEFGLTESSGYRDLDNLRQMFDPIGNLDTFLQDYYNRHKAAPENAKHSIPLFPNPADRGLLLYNMAVHGNVSSAGFTPPAMVGVGQSGVIKRLLFMFQNYVLRLAAQFEKIADKDLRDPKLWREAYAFWGMLATMILFVLAGILATETGVPATRLITGRSPSRVTLANVVNNPDAAMIARYTGMALANNLPYYGQVISELFGNPGYGSRWDAANIIPIAGLIKDTSIALTRVKQTHDPIFPALDFLGRWFPPASPVIRLLPGIQGDIEAKNAARALRVVGPSAGMELAGGSGAVYAQTPATVATRRLLAAAYRGDEEGVRRAFDQAVAERAELGSPDPARAVMQSLAAAIPARRVFGRSITPAEEQQLLARMSGPQRRDYDEAQSAFDLINRTLGAQYRLTSEPQQRRTTTRRSGSRGARRRSLFGATRSPRLRRLRTRRSPFSRMRIRRTRRRRRMTGSLSMAA